MSIQTPPAQIGSLEIFWPLIEPILDALSPQRVCEVGIASGALTTRLLAWSDKGNCTYVGVDPAPEPTIRERFTADVAARGRRLLLQPSLAALPDVGRCDVYFLDGDHNYFTVHGELEMIAAAALTTTPQECAPVIFLHDVGWPWGRRDMYYLPSNVPEDARRPWSETLGVALDGDELVEGGLREPGRYAIALRSGGPRNGVLTAAEDFLKSEAGAGWEMIVLPVAYGFAVLYRSGDPELPAACRERLEGLRNMAVVGSGFLQACEQNFLRLYLYGEYHQHAAAAERLKHHATLGAYDNLHVAYKELLSHSNALEEEYQRLHETCEQLRKRAVTDGGSPQAAAAQDYSE